MANLVPSWVEVEMALLTGGHHLGLAQSSSSTDLSSNAASSASDNKSVVFVKLTDSAYAAISSYVKRQVKKQNNQTLLQHKTLLQPASNFSNQIIGIHYGL